MERINGYIRIDEMLKAGGGAKYIDLNASSHLEFNYKGETYFYKYNEDILPYSELVAEELAKDYGLFCVSYDLASLNGIKGVISKNYKKKNANYILADDILSYCFNSYHNGKCLSIDEYNNLDSIWTALDYYYRDKKNKIAITHNLMSQIVDIFLFDIITCQPDRHTRNWEIMEKEDSINISPLYDNERILKYREEDAIISISISESEDENLWEALKKFQHLSSDEFNNLIEKRLWIISEENLMSVFERIEKKTNHSMPEKCKNFYLDGYKKHKEKIEEIVYNKSRKDESSRRLK